MRKGLWAKTRHKCIEKSAPVPFNEFASSLNDQRILRKRTSKADMMRSLTTILTIMAIIQPAFVLDHVDLEDFEEEEEDRQVAN